MRSDRVGTGGTRIGLSEPNIGGREWEYVKQCLDAGWVSSAGEFVNRFESEFAAAVGARHAVSTTSGTAAIHMALMLSGVGRDDEVVMPSLTFIAPANAVRYVDAYPVFVDVERGCWQMDPARTEEFLRDGCERRADGLRNRSTGRRVRALLPVDVLGHPVDLDAIHRLAAEFDLAVVEDATESLGATYKGRPLGPVSRLTCFSFNGNKLLTTGSGGMITTDDAELAQRAKYLTTQAKDDSIEFVHGAVGYNYRLSNVQAAIGVAQLERLEEFVSAKCRIASRYDAFFAGVAGAQPLCEAPWARSAWWLYTVALPETIPGGRQAVRLALSKRGIETRPLWQPMHASPAHRASHAETCPVTDELRRRCLSLPCSTHLTAEQQELVIDSVRDALGAEP